MLTFALNRVESMAEGSSLKGMEGKQHQMSMGQASTCDKGSRTATTTTLVATYECG